MEDVEIQNWGAKNGSFFQENFKLSLVQFSMLEDAWKPYILMVNCSYRVALFVFFEK